MKQHPLTTRPLCDTTERGAATDTICDIAKRMGRVMIQRSAGTGICPICIEPIDSKKWSRHLPCGHTFHSECLRAQQFSSVLSRDLCALCRSDIPPARGAPPLPVAEEDEDSESEDVVVMMEISQLGTNETDMDVHVFSSSDFDDGLAQPSAGIADSEDVSPPVDRNHVWRNMIYQRIYDMLVESVTDVEEQE